MVAPTRDLSRFLNPGDHWQHRGLLGVGQSDRTLCSYGVLRLVWECGLISIVFGQVSGDSREILVHDDGERGHVEAQLFLPLFKKSSSCREVVEIGLKSVGLEVTLCVSNRLPVWADFDVTLWRIVNPHSCFQLHLAIMEKYIKSWAKSSNLTSHFQSLAKSERIPVSMCLSRRAHGRNRRCGQYNRERRKQRKWGWNGKRIKAWNTILNLALNLRKLKNRPSTFKSLSASSASSLLLPVTWDIHTTCPSWRLKSPPTSASI